MAAYILVKLQSIISREIDPAQMAVLTCGSIHAGDAANVIPDYVDLKMNVRTFSEAVAKEIEEAIFRIVQGECKTSRAPRDPEIKIVHRYPLTTNDEKTVNLLKQQFDQHFGGESHGMERATASEDFSVLANACGKPYVWWTIGGTDQKQWDRANAEGKTGQLPGNHSSKFAPAIEPTLKTGIQAMFLAALTMLQSQ